MLDLNGVKTAVEATIGDVQSVPGSAPADQLSLLCEVGTDQPHAEKVVPAPRGAGRPPGATNKSTKEWVNLFHSMHRSPIMALGEISTMDIPALAAKLGLKPELLTYEKALELVRFQAGCMTALLPYVHQKMPTAIDAGENGLIQLVINNGVAGTKTTTDGDDLRMEIIDLETMENQWVNEDKSANSVTGHSVTDQQTESNQGVNDENQAD